MGIQLRNIIVGLSFLAVAFCANAAQMKVRLDANGGKVTTATIVVSDDDDGAYGELPVPTALGGKEFDGWWTAKTGGIKVAEGDAVDFSIFANPKSPVLYAQWLQDRQITVGGGYLEDGSTFQSVWPGDRVDVYSNEAQLFDKNGNMINAFGSWSVSPSGLDLGEDFNPFYPEATVTMPNADVKLTANYVNGVAAYLSFGYETRGDAEPGDFYWSVDGGKTLVPFGNEYPVKAGNVTVKFYDKSGLWHAPADIKINVAKRDTYKDGAVTYYEDPMNIGQTVTFVAVEGSYRVTFNANGGKTDTTSIWCVEGEDYSGLPVPARSGYVFAG